MIELLIVAGILVMLAAIALPNFQASVVRAKYARALSDMRTMKGGIEAYQADHGRYPRETFGEQPYGDYYEEGGVRRPLRGTLGPWITTPVAYIERFDLPDAFGSGSPRFMYGYEEVASQFAAEKFPHFGLNLLYYERFREDFGAYAMNSVGPDRVVAPIGANVRELYTAYDPTNGTMSLGNIWMSQKSAATVPWGVRRWQQ